MYKLILLSFIAAASCGSPKTSTDVTSGNNTTTSTQVQKGTVTLSLGEEITVGSLRVQFKEVLEDSRCPKGTTCFWQGRVKILTTVREEGEAANTSEVIFGELKKGEIKNHSFYKSDTTTLTAIAVNPYPTKDSGTTNLTYELVLEVNK